MRGRWLLITCASIATAAPALDPKPFMKVPPTWREATSVPAGKRSPALVHTEGPGEKCKLPVELQIDALRSIVISNPCGDSLMTLRTGKRGCKNCERILESRLAGGAWTGFKLSDNTVLMISDGKAIYMWAVDLRKRATLLPSPRIHEPTIELVGGELFVSGGMVTVTVDEGGCEGTVRPCDRIASHHQVPNPSIWAIRPKT